MFILDFNLTQTELDKLAEKWRALYSSVGRRELINDYDDNDNDNDDATFVKNTAATMK